MITRLTDNFLQQVYNLGIELHQNFKDLYNFESLNTEFNETYVYVDNNSILGFIHIQSLADEINIIDIVVDSSMRKKGIGCSLIEHVFNIYPDKRFILEVSCDNTGALNLYKKLGFVQISVRSKYYNGVDAVVMERKN